MSDIEYSVIKSDAIKSFDCIYFLHRCLLRDDRLRWSSTQLLDHSFLKEPVPALLPPPDKEEPEPKKDGELSVLIFFFF